MSLFLRVRTLGFCAAFTVIAACATSPGGNLQALNDPWEKTNRSIYNFNRGLDKAVVSPTTKVYRAVIPKAAQRGIGNAFSNAHEPFSFVNALLQGKVGQAVRTLQRFTINTVLGVGGLADHATDMGRPKELEDLGQTLAVWGVKSGPYVMLPFFGPSTLRDGTGFVVERFADPYRIAISEAHLKTAESLGLTGVEVIDTRSYLMDTTDSLLNGSADEYATVRSAYIQFRESLIYDGNPPEEEFVPLPTATDTDAAAEQQGASDTQP